MLFELRKPGMESPDYDMKPIKLINLLCGLTKIQIAEQKHVLKYKELYLLLSVKKMKKLTVCIFWPKFEATLHVSLKNKTIIYSKDKFLPIS